MVGDTRTGTESPHVDGRQLSWKDVGLERREAALHNLPAQERDVFHTAEGRCLQVLVVLGPRGTAVGPVEAKPLSHRSSEEFHHGYPQVLGLYVQQCLLDPSNAFGSDRTWTLP